MSNTKKVKYEKKKEQRKKEIREWQEECDKYLLKTREELQNFIDVMCGEAGTKEFPQYQYGWVESRANLIKDQLTVLKKEINHVRAGKEPEGAE